MLGLFLSWLEFILFSLYLIKIPVVQGICDLSWMWEVNELCSTRPPIEGHNRNYVLLTLKSILACYCWGKLLIRISPKTVFLNIFCRSQNGDQLFLAEPRSRWHIHHNLLHSEPGKDRNNTFLFPEEREIEFLTHLDVCMNTNFITFMKTLHPVINFLIFECFDKNYNIHQ